ncbi:heme lyase NrfEFG subunit NrfF [Photobacterium frigidiphilum]|uniref:heme lyase NrfEFG subunit NrfF n=1 Tax=Photobacterium frigidiphilum TaxID=264736 RepID=UPI003D1104CC
MIRLYLKPLHLKEPHLNLSKAPYLALIFGFIIVILSVLLPVQASGEQIFIAADSQLVESVETFQFRSPLEHKRALELAKTLRCPQCQNQNLIESNSPVAKDLRLKVYQMINAGSSDQEVIEFMTSRFGDFVLYHPKFTPQTYVLWLAPFFILLLFGLLGIRSIRSNRREDKA